MASFCRQCSIEMFGEDFGDYRRGEEEKKLDLSLSPDSYFFYPVICEECGPWCEVDDEGVCIGDSCLMKHGAKENRVPCKDCKGKGVGSCRTCSGRGWEPKSLREAEESIEEWKKRDPRP